MGEAGKVLVFSYWLRRRNLDRHRAGERETALSGERGRVRLLLRRGVKHAVDLNDIVGDQFEIAEGLNDARLRILHQTVGHRIDALHSGDEDKVSGSDAQAPGPLGLDGAGRIESPDTAWRCRLGKAESRRHSQRR